MYVKSHVALRPSAQIERSVTNKALLTRAHESREISVLYSLKNNRINFRMLPDAKLLNALKAYKSSKIDIFIKERFNKLIYGIDTIIKCGI